MAWSSRAATSALASFRLSCFSFLRAGAQVCGAREDAPAKRACRDCRLALHAASRLQAAPPARGAHHLGPPLLLPSQSPRPPSSPRRHGDQLGPHFELQLAHAHEVLRDLGQPLLVLMHQELGPVGQVLVQLL